MTLIKNLSIIFFFSLVFVSCNFKKNNSVYDSFLEDKTLVFYLKFNREYDDESNQKIKKNAGMVPFDKDRFGNDSSSVIFKGDNFLSYGDVLDSVFSGEKKRFSFSFWIRPSQNNRDATIISKNSDSNCGENERQFNLKYTKDNKVQFIWLYNNKKYNGYRIIVSKEKLRNNEWQNIIITYNGYSNGGDGQFRSKLYLNGENIEFNHVGGRGKLAFIEDKRAHFALGNMVSSRGEVCSNSFFKGSLDDLMIFNRVLTKNEIETISSLAR